MVRNIKQYILLIYNYALYVTFNEKFINKQ